METITTSYFATEKNLVQVAGELSSILGKNITEEEKNGRLSLPVVNALKEAGFYKLYLPKSLGGLEADPLAVAKVVEEVASHNTAAGWSLMVVNTTLNMAARLPEKGIDEIFVTDPDMFIAGSVHPPMMASRVEGGYLINGRNALVSNVHEANWIMALGLVIEGGKPKVIDNHPEIIVIYLKISDCNIIDTWNVLGMKATDSNDVEAKDVFVPDHRLFPLTNEVHPDHRFEGPL